MNTRPASIAAALLALAAALVLSACGNKGKLVLPDKPQAEETVPAQPAAEASPEASPETSPETSPEPAPPVPLDNKD